MRPAALKVLACLALALAGAVALRLWAGGWPDGENASLLFQIRGGRLAAGLIVGAALGCAGAMLQCLLRNPLASPDLLGLASGAGLGVMVAVYAAYLLTGRIAQAGVGGVGAAGAAIAGAIGTLSLVYLLGRRKGVVDPVSLVLVGVVISMLASAGIALVQTLLPDRGVAAARLLLGALPDDAGRGTLLSGAAVVLACVCYGAWKGPALDAMMLGDDEAASSGVDLRRCRAVLFLLAGLLAAVSVVIAGPIGFVGLVTPHAVRALTGPGHRAVIPASALAGAMLVVLADSAVRAAADAGLGVRLPINLVTTLVGAPVFIAMLLKARRAVW